MTELTGDWTWTGDDLTLEERTPHGIFRARVAVDTDPLEPYDDGACPVFDLDDIDAGPRIGAESDRASGIDFPAAVSHFRNAYGVRDWREALDRWLRIYHGGTVLEGSSSMWQGLTFLTYTTRAMRESWGLAGDALDDPTPDATEWEAYIDGEVFVIWIERASFDDDGEVVDWLECEDWPVGGYYGEDYAKRTAEEALAEEIDRTAAGMLPLEGVAV